MAASKASRIATSRRPGAAAAAALALVLVSAMAVQAALFTSFDKVSVTANQFDATLQHNVANLAVTRGGVLTGANFLDFYNRNGGLARWGFATSEIFEETGGTLTQYYQRGVVDWHPVAGGVYLLEARNTWDFVGGGMGGSVDLGVEPGLTNPNHDDLLGPWGHKVSNQAVDGTAVGFKTFFDRLGGKNAFGFPKTDARPDTHPQAKLTAPGSNPAFTRQYFQRAVLEFHPGSAEPVKIGLIGDTLRSLKYPNNTWQALDAFKAAAPITAGQTLFPPGPVRAEYGDAPDGGPTGYPGPFAQTGRFPSLSASNGARALSVDGARLGATASVELDANDPADPDGVPNLTNTDRDDVVTNLVMALTQMPPPTALSVRVTGGSGGSFFLNVLIDLNLDGTWGGATSSGAPEWVVKNYAVSVAAGETKSVTPPPFAFANGNRLPDGAWMRISLTKERVTATDWTGTGGFTSGEIEDHVIQLPLIKNKPAVIPTVDCNGPYRFGPGVAVVGWSCTITNNGPGAGAVRWSLRRLSGGVVINPPITGVAVVLAAAPGPGNTAVVAGTANRGDLPSEWEMRVVAIDPDAVISSGGVTVGFGDGTDTMPFTGENACALHVGAITPSYQHFVGESDAIFGVLILDAQGAPFPGAGVFRLVTGPPGPFAGPFEVRGTTGPNGLAEIRQRTQMFGDYPFQVTNVTGGDCTYDSSANVVSGATATLK
ncbi:MAG: hypothetical protein FJ029_03420 [Actinobacteria bacterium]|nr:hypothetical protein [Actinomycetota bacterium]